MGTPPLGGMWSSKPAVGVPPTRRSRHQVPAEVPARYRHRVGQLKLTLSDGDIAAIRSQASERGVGISELVRLLALGDQPSADVLDQLRSDLASLTRRLSDLEARSPWDAVEELQRRLEPIAEAFERTRY